jgi:hypothetical protein
MSQETQEPLVLPPVDFVIVGFGLPLEKSLSSKRNGNRPLFDVFQWDISFWIIWQTAFKCKVPWLWKA